MTKTPDTELLNAPRWQAGDLGAPLPPSTHANSVCLPMWQDVIDYEEKRPRVLERLKAGYPRFVIPPMASRFFEVCREKFAQPGERCLAYPSLRAAQRSVDSIRRWTGATARVQPWAGGQAYVVFHPETAHEAALKHWRHTGDGVSSRRAEALLTGAAELDGTAAKAIVRARIAALMDVPVDCVLLFKTGMSAIYTVHRAVSALKPGARCVQFGFPYVDTLKIQQDLGPGSLFFPFGSDAELPALAEAMAREPVAGLFSEYPSNPLLVTPDLQRLDALGAKYGTPVIVDDTISTYANVNPLPAADVVVTSLTKFFTGRGDVMAGAVVLNPKRPLFARLREALAAEFEDLIWGGDALLMDAYSADFTERMARVNETTASLCTWLKGRAEVEAVYYPLFRDRARYDAFRRPGGGYSGLFSLLLKDAAATSERFFDALEISKGPNLGTTFSLACPYTMLAHYDELPWAEQCGVSRHLIRFSIGLECLPDLQARFERAFAALHG